MKTKQRHMHRYIRTVMPFQHVAHLAKSASMQQLFEQFVGKQRRLERQLLNISEAELLRFDRVSPFSLQGQCMAQFILIYVF